MEWFTVIDGGVMADKTVDVFIDGELLISYPISLAGMNTAPTDKEFIDLAKEKLAEDKYSPEAIACATFNVR